MIRVLAAVLLSSPCAVQDGPPLELGTRRELFVDRFLVETLRGAELQLRPLRRAPDSPEPPLQGGYTTVLADGGLFRMYARGYLVPGAIWKNVGKEAGALNEITIYAESRDGIRWTRPNLGLFDIGAVDERLLAYARENEVRPTTEQGNIVLAGDFSASHNFTPFIDSRPGVPPEERYKAVGGNAYDNALEKKYGPAGLRAFVSADGRRWKRLQDAPLFPVAWGKLDSQNLAFWSELEKRYVLYFRYFEQGRRAIRRTTSEDFRRWSEPVAVEANLPGEQLYTNNVQPYFRAPHLYVAPATRYIDGQRPNTFVILMTSRDGIRFDRTFGQEVFKETLGGDRTNYLAWTNGVQTSPTELSFFDHGGRRYVLRLDGFGALHAGPDPGEMVSRLLTFSGSRLELNAKAVPGGALRIELQDAAGKPLPGFSLDEAVPFTGDAVDHLFAWKGGHDLSTLPGRPVRLRIVLRDADLYSLRFP